MNRRFVTIAVGLALWLALVPNASAQLQAVIRETTGKVEIQEPGGSWQAARAGMNLSRGAMISTGFNSNAVLDLSSSVLQVKPLTRMQLQELVEREGTVSTELFLKVGKVRAEVKSVEGLTQDFKLKSPVSTAAVRGTTIEFESLIVEVINGQVTFTNLYNQSRTVSEGEESSTEGFTPPTSGQQAKEEQSTVVKDTSPTGTGGIVTTPGPPRPTTATVTIQWVWN